MSASTHRELIEDDFLARFKPVPNHIDPNAGFDGACSKPSATTSPMCGPRTPTWSGPCSTATASSRSPADFMS